MQTIADSYFSAFWRSFLFHYVYSYLFNSIHAKWNDGGHFHKAHALGCFGPGEAFTPDGRPLGGWFHVQSNWWMLGLVLLMLVNAGQYHHQSSPDSFDQVTHARA